MAKTVDFRALFEGSPNAYMVLDRELRNESAERLRASLDRVLATRRPDVIAWSPYRVPLGDAAESLEAVRYRSATHTPILDAQGEVELVLQHTVDVTELHRTATPGDGPAQVEAGILGRARVIEDANRDLRRLFDQAPAFAALVGGPEHVFELANAAFLQIGGRSNVGTCFTVSLPYEAPASSTAVR